MASNIRPAGTFDTDYQQDLAINRTRFSRLIVNALFVALLIVPLLTADGPLGLNIIPVVWVGTIVRIAIYTIAVQGLNILMGYTGQISLGHAAFMGVGAYSAALIVRASDLPFFIVIPLAAIVTAFVGLLFGLPSLRVKGFYLAMATLAAQFIIPWVLRYPLADITNGSRPLNLPDPMIGGINFAPQSAMFYIVIPLAVMLSFLARNIIRTRTGRAFISIRDNDLAAELLGINVFSYKLQAFFISSLYAGIAGALWAFDVGSLSLDKFNLGLSIEFLAMLVLGGAGFPLGALFGVSFLIILNESIIPVVVTNLKVVLPQIFPFLSAVNVESSLVPFLFGLALIVFLILEPRGIAYRWEILKIAWKIRPYSY